MAANNSDLEIPRVLIQSLEKSRPALSLALNEVMLLVNSRGKPVRVF